MDTFTKGIQECMKINMEIPRPATLTNFWVRKTRVGFKMIYNAIIAELESPEQACLAFLMQILMKWIYCDYYTLLQAMLFVS